MKGSRLLLDGMVAKRSEEERAAGGAWATFRADLRTGWAELVKRTSRAHARWVFVVIAVGAILRLSQLWQDITYDEALAYTLYGTRSTGFILSNYVHPSNHILHTVLSRWSTELFGVHLWSLRLPAFLAGVGDPTAKAIAGRLATYRRQFVGVVREEGRRILGNYFCDTTMPASVPVMVDDGGSCYFNVLYDPSRRTFDRMSVNGEG